MKQKLPTPLRIDCSGLSGKRTQILFERLQACFNNLELWDGEIVAANPFSQRHYDSAWRILDQCGVKVNY